MKVLIGADHGGFHLKEKIVGFLKEQGYEPVDLGFYDDRSSDYPDIAEKMAKELKAGKAEKGILICGSGVGVSVAANKFEGIRASVCHDTYSARQGVEDDNMNVLCLGARIIGDELAKEVAMAFLKAKFKALERYLRRLKKVEAFEKRWKEKD